MLIDLQKQTLTMDSVLCFGKYKGKYIYDIPLSYVKWMVINVSTYDYDDELNFIAKNYIKENYTYREEEYYTDNEIIETSKYSPHRAMDMAEDMRFNGNGVSLDTWKRVCREVQCVESGIKRGW